ncbi:rRNA maturation RNase YbeY [uncultured Desulfobacter sp.]|uniref:rRNA maturation RNase YbeY n=1 Tax=uncultured Desulfobacter sp. TaxID=240139 RepID=UPI0029F56559|nr:rRNA maturation RNase YbeY [uncultured Desulfobacter sp.]
MEKLKILIDNQQKERLPTAPLHQKTEQILNALGCNNHEISIVVTDDVQVRDLNRSYRGKDTPTNVLSFPMQEGEFSDITPGLLGDVVISLDTARAEAQAGGISTDERMSQLLIHGILHLIGFDHELGEIQALEMEEKSLELLRIIEPNIDLPAF